MEVTEEMGVSEVETRRTNNSPRGKLIKHGIKTDNTGGSYSVTCAERQITWRKIARAMFATSAKKLAIKQPTAGSFCNTRNWLGIPPHLLHLAQKTVKSSS